MKNNINTKLCIICIKSNSSGIKNKNFKLINGKPLFSYTIEQAKSSKIFDKIIVSTDSYKALKMIKKYNVDYIFIRPKNISFAKTDKLKVIRNALKVAENYFNLRFSYIFDLDVTSPLRKISDIKNSFREFKKKESDNLFTVCKSKKNPSFNIVEFYKNEIKLVKKSSKNIVARQNAPKVYDMNASIYIWKRAALLRKNLFNKKTSVYVMPPERSIDIDDFFDLKLVKLLIK